MMADESYDDNTQSFIALTSGTAVSHYSIIEKIGAGGMGEVYLAEDTKLKRKVALKFLPRHLCQDEDCRKRFKREAQAAAGLDHPNIAAIYEVGDFRGRPFYSMQVIPGQSLKDVIAGKDLAIERILEIAIQICEGLQAAHEKGIIHRDVKPSNILLDGHGRVRIVDFGLASIRGSEHLTKTGSTLGTIGYMSPEQVQGKDTDHRSDLFSLGVVLYELITKQNPFRRDSEAATLKAVSDDTPHPIARYRADMPDGLQTMIDKILERDVSLRYQHANGLAADLKRIIREEGTGAREGDPRPSVAVLPFEDMSQNRDQQYLCDGLTEELISALACVHGLRVVSRTSSFSFRDTREDIREIGRKLSVSTILEGSIRRAGNRIRVTAQLIEAESGYHVWTEKYDRQMEDVFAIEDDVTASIVSALRPELLRKKVTIARPQTTNLEAYNEYLLGLALWNKRTDDGLMKSLDHFSRAVFIDPKYTMAYCGIAAAYNVMAGYCLIYPRTGLEKSMEASQKALETDPNVGEAHGRLAMNLWELNQAAGEAEKGFERALDLSPNSTAAMNDYCEMLSVLGRFGEASRLNEMVFNLDPLAWRAKAHTAQLALYTGDDRAAELQADQMLTIDPLFLPALRLKSKALAQKGDLKTACAIATKVLEMAGEHPVYIASLGYLSGLSGNRTKALECLNRLDALEGKRFVPSHERAQVHLGMQNYDEVLAELEQGIEEGYCRILVINVDPRFNPLKKMPRFQKLVTKLNLV